jgi:hypothetical protein
METDSSIEHSQSERAIRVIAFAVLAGCSGIVLYAIQTASFTKFYSVLSVGLLIACASMIAGGLAGFLFGIPKTLQQEKPEPLPPDKQMSNQSQDQILTYQTNTNLEQISDWLTKIIVGVGLTQLTSLPEALRKFSEFAAPGLGGSQGSKIFSVALLLFYLVCGFLISYLWTRIYLKGELVNADKLSVVRKTVAELGEFQKQAEFDARALNIVMSQLNSSPDAPRKSQEEISSAIKNASMQVKTQIFYQASETRSRNWSDPKTKHVMEWTIPVFRALIEDDKDDRFHQNHGQLGFALKDKNKPDYAEAEKELTKAIDIRRKRNEKGWLIYEFARAICRIMQDKDFESGKSCDEDTKEKILSDLKAAAHAPILKDIISDDENTKKWLSVNKIRWPR